MKKIVGLVSLILSFVVTLQAENLSFSWEKIQEEILSSLKDFERQNIDGQFCVEKGFLEDWQYLKNKNNFLNDKSYQMLSQWSQDRQVRITQIEMNSDQQLTPATLTNEMKRLLVLEAQRARTSAYAPYSHFHVGAAILTKSGKVYSGCNYENAAYGNTICAERSAIASALTSENRGLSFQKDKNIVAVAVVLRGGNGSPCGNCRQGLFEFNPNMLVIMSDIDNGEYTEMYLKDLLPMGFGPSCLEDAIIK